MPGKKTTPMMKQYQEIKAQYTDAILLFRLGDFYEAFFEDAKTVSKTLQLVLTHRNGNDMAGIPYHALENYLKKLVNAGFKVAICEQVEDPKEAKGIVRREVTRIVTPGTVVEESLIEDSSNIFMASVMDMEDDYYVVLLDISTGQSMIFKRDNWSTIEDILKKFDVVQLLYPETGEWEMRIIGTKKQLKDLYAEPLPGWYYNHSESVNQLKRVFDVGDLAFLELPNEAVTLFGATLKYLEYQHMNAFYHLSRPMYMNNMDRMMIDNTTVENLNLFSSRGDRRSKSLFDVINSASTSMGNRKLKDWLLSPLRNEDEILKRLDHVRELYSDEVFLEELQMLLNDIYDIERIISRLSYKKIQPADYVSLKSTLETIPGIMDLMDGRKTFIDLYEELDPLEELCKLLERALYDEPDSQVGLGKTIRQGFKKELDSYRELLQGSGEKLKELEEYERKRTGISKLRIRKNKVYGYYIEVSKANASKVPDDYERKQTLVSSERYISDALKPIEEDLNRAIEMVEALEKEAFRDLIEMTFDYIGRLQKNATALACVDVYVSLAKTAVKNGYCEPAFNKNGDFSVLKGRHPVVEEFEEQFIPNDLVMDHDNSFIILTGPNMSGKSTYLRQTALICLLAQTGSFVPAERANLPILDRIFTRIGARDDLSSGKSTFLVEMSETATILNNATEDSLVILDEVGRGTSTYDGISIAWVVSEHLYSVVGAYTIFATHYNELTELSNLYSGMKNMRVEVTEKDGSVIFLHKVADGVASKSYGIEVARIAGLPPSVVERAHDVLSSITAEKKLDKKIRVLGNQQLEEIKSKTASRKIGGGRIRRRKKRATENQLSIFERGDND